MPKRSGKTSKSLQGNGYTGCQKAGSVSWGGGASVVQTISARDFSKLITWDAVINKRQESIALLAAFAETGLTDVLERLFKNQSIADLLERITHYSQWSNHDLQQALTSNYDDWAIIQEQELFALM